MSSKPRILLVGGGAVGAIAALNLEAAGQAHVTLVCRSNYATVSQQGYTIDSCDHGQIRGWKPSVVLNSIPQISPDTPPFDYLICTTKNIPDVPPSLASLIAPAVTPGKTVIVLIQNGLNIELPFLSSFPSNPILSGVSLIGTSEPSHGQILQDFPDTLFIGPFHNANLAAADEEAAAKRFVELYSAGGKTQCSYNADTGWTRWRKLVYNACLNPICAITGLDTGRIRLADGVVEGLGRPAMNEIVAAAKASGYELPDRIVDDMIETDPLTLYLPPSMLSDVRKGNLIEYENLLGEPLREGEKRGVPMPTLKVLYQLCRAVQWKTMEERGMVTVPPKGS